MNGNYVNVEPTTDKLVLHLPLAKLMVDGGKTVGFELGLSTPYSGVSDIDLVPSGVYGDRMLKGRTNPNFREFRIPLYDGRIIAFGTRDTDDTTETVTIMHSNADTLLRNSTGVRSTGGRGTSSSAVASREETQFKGSDFMLDTSSRVLTVRHTNGVSETFDVVTSSKFMGINYGTFHHHPLLRREISYPCGTRLNFKWDDGACPRIIEINDGKSKLLVAKWWQGKEKPLSPPKGSDSIVAMQSSIERILEEAVFFPGTDKEFACRGVSPESRNFDVSGSGIDGKKRHSIG